MIPALGLTPFGPYFEQSGGFDDAAGGDDAALAQKGADGATEVFKVLHGLGGRGGLHEIAALSDAAQAGDAPIEDAGQFDEQPIGEAVVFPAVEAVGQHQHDEPGGQRAAGIGQAGQFVGEDQEPGLQPSGPGVAMNLRSMVIASSPVIDRSRSAMAC